jgi:hypothetical protein
MPRAHVKRFDVALDGRLFRNQAGNYVDAAAQGITWARVRECAGLTGENPGRAPFFVRVDEARLLRRIRHQEVLFLLMPYRQRIADLRT